MLLQTETSKQLLDDFSSHVIVLLIFLAFCGLFWQTLDGFLWNFTFSCVMKDVSQDFGQSRQNYLGCDQISAELITFPQEMEITVCSGPARHRQYCSWTVEVKRELSQTANLWVYQSISVPALTWGHELWVVTERMRSEMVRSSDVRELGVKPSSWSGHLIMMPPVRLPLEVSKLIRPGGDPGADPEFTGEITYLIWLGNTSGSPGRSCWEKDVRNNLLSLRLNPG